jgi:hypothetical protein
MEPVRALRWSTMVSVVLALISLGMAVAWKREHDRAQCWQAAAEEDQPGSDCR